MKKYEFTENERCYLLMLNGQINKFYSKISYSKQEAESKAADIVNKAYQKYGYRKVIFDGLLSPEDFKNHY